MYKINFDKEYYLLIIYLLTSVVLGVFVIFGNYIVQNMGVSIETIKDIKFISIFLIIFIISCIFGIFYQIILIKKYKYLSKNGILLKNTPFTYKVDSMYEKNRNN